jgi:hypothetical protein
MRSINKRIGGVLLSVTATILLGLLSSFYSKGYCERRNVRDVIIGSRSTFTNIGSGIKMIAGKNYNFQDSKEIVKETLQLDSTIKQIIDDRRSEIFNDELSGEDPTVFSFSRAKVIFPFFVCADSEIKYQHNLDWGIRSYYLVIFNNIVWSKTKTKYRLE